MRRLPTGLKKTALFFVILFLAAGTSSAHARSHRGHRHVSYLSAKSAVVLDASSGAVLYAKNPHLKLPPASTTKIMTVLVALDHLKADQRVTVGHDAVITAQTKAGLTEGTDYRMWDLVTACLVSSSNDAAIALADATAGSEDKFVGLMNEKAASLGMNDTKFVNATGLTDKRRKQYSSAYDLTLLMRAALKDARLDPIMGIIRTSIQGSDGKVLYLKAHNKLLWERPHFVKGKTGWTYASRHTFVGTNYSPEKKIMFAMLSSTQPWTDIEHLATLGMKLESKNG